MSLHIYLFFDDCIYGKFAWEESLRVTWFDGGKHQVFGCCDKKARGRNTCLNLRWFFF